MSTRSGDVKTNRCPRCGCDTLAFTRRYAVLTAESALLRTGTDPHNGRDRLRYETAWVCQNSHCDYRDLVGEE